MKKNIGVWMDSDKAHIIDNEKDQIHTILSEMEHYNLGGGSKANTPYGAQDASSETKLEERKKHQMKRYFKDIQKHISDANNVAVFGPGETKIAFAKMAQKNPELNDKLRAVETVGNKLTDNQLKEWVRNFYTE